MVYTKKGHNTGTYTGHHASHGLLEKYKSQSKRTGEEKIWIGKKFENLDFALADAMTGSLAVEVFGKSNAPKTKISHEKRMLVSRVPEGRPYDLGQYIIKSSKIPSGSMPESLVSAIAIKMIMGDSDIKFSNIVRGKSRKDEKGNTENICFSIDGEFAGEGIGKKGDHKNDQLRRFTYDEFEDMVKNPALFVSYGDPSLSSSGKVINSRSNPHDITVGKRDNIIKYLSKDIKPENIINAFSDITEKLQEDNYAIFDKVIGRLDGNKGILPDIKKGYKNGIYNAHEVAKTVEKLGELKGKIISFADDFATYTQMYKDRVSEDRPENIWQNRTELSKMGCRGVI